MFVKRSLLALGVAVLLTGCGGGDSGNTSHNYYFQGGLLWSGTLSGALPGGQFLWDGVAQFMSDSASYQCSGKVSVNGGPVVPNNFNKEAGWRLPMIAELQALYAVNHTPPNWQIGMVWADSLDGPKRLDFSTGRVISGNGSTGLVVCVKPSI